LLPAGIEPARDGVRARRRFREAVEATTNPDVKAAAVVLAKAERWA
jgi:hypothetical protein